MKALGGFGITSYQKNRLTEEALKDGKLIALIPCSLKESGVLGTQSGMVAITKKTVVFGQTGKSTQLGLKFRFSWFQRFPLSTVLNSSKEYKEYYWGALKAYHFTYFSGGTRYELTFNKENGESFERHLAEAKS